MRSAGATNLVASDVVAPYFGDRMSFVAVLESGGKLHGPAVEHRVHVGNGARQVLDPRPVGGEVRMGSSQESVELIKTARLRMKVRPRTKPNGEPTTAEPGCRA